MPHEAEELENLISIFRIQFSVLSVPPLMAHLGHGVLVHCCRTPPLSQVRAQASFIVSNIPGPRLTLAYSVSIPAACPPCQGSPEQRDHFCHMPGPTP